MIKEKILELLDKVDNFQTDSPEKLEQFRIRLLGSKGELKSLFKDFKDVPNEQKKEVGQLINELKEKAQEKTNELKSLLSSSSDASSSTEIDYTRPGAPVGLGARHPISLTRMEINAIFERIGFTISDGPEIEFDWYNFTALNLPPEHPARDMHDTFYIKRDGEQSVSLRSHTSTVQVHVMEDQKPPIRTISPGRVYRSDNDSTHLPAFHQVEGLYIAKDVSFADLKQVLMYFVKEMFGDRKIQLRPSFFPFTEPSAELDVAWEVNGKTKWMEILGCGMVDPQVLENCGIDSKVYSGYAFGMGIERIAMLKYGITDIRAFYENDVRFLKQFKTVDE